MRLGEAPDMSLPVLLSVRKVPGGATPSQQEAAVSAVPPGPPSLPTAAASAPSSSKKRSFFRIFHRSATLLFQGQIYTYESLRDEAFTEIKLSHSLIGPKSTVRIRWPVVVAQEMEKRAEWTTLAHPTHYAISCVTSTT